MSVHGGTTISEKDASTTTFPQFPGEDFPQHVATQYKEIADSRLAARKLLAVAQSGGRRLPPACDSIVDVDLSELPELPPAHRDHERRHENRTKYIAMNKANAQKRRTITLDAWTELYTLLAASTETSRRPCCTANLRTCATCR